MILECLLRNLFFQEEKQVSNVEKTSTSAAAIPALEQVPAEAKSVQPKGSEHLRPMRGPLIPDRLRAELVKKQEEEQVQGEREVGALAAESAESAEKRSRRDRGRKRRKADEPDDAKEETKKASNVYDPQDEKYATWLPPSGQTGDGVHSKTSKLKSQNSFCVLRIEIWGGSSQYPKTQQLSHLSQNCPLLNI